LDGNTGNGVAIENTTILALWAATLRVEPGLLKACSHAQPRVLERAHDRVWGGADTLVADAVTVINPAGWVTALDELTKRSADGVDQDCLADEARVLFDTLDAAELACVAARILHCPLVEIENELPIARNVMRVNVAYFATTIVEYVSDAYAICDEKLEPALNNTLEKFRQVLDEADRIESEWVAEMEAELDD
jgi:hypothetical protein